MPRRPAIMTMKAPARQREIATRLATGLLRRQTQSRKSREPAEKSRQSSLGGLADGQ